MILSSTLKARAILVMTLATLSASGFAQEVKKPDGFGPSPKAPKELVVARPFKTEKPVEFQIRGKKVEAKEGFIVVLKVDKELLKPMNAPDHLLLVEHAIGQKINSGFRSGYVVAMIPKTDLTKNTLWFSSRMLPKELNQARFQQERKRATARSLKPQSKKALEKALKAGGDMLVCKDMNELWFESASLIRKYSPDEKELADSLRK